MDTNGIIRFYELKKNEEVQLHINEAQLWAKDILDELEEGLDPNEFSSVGKSHLHFDGKIKKGTGGKYGDYLMVDGSLEFAYYTYCSQSGEPMLAQQTLEVHVCCLDDDNKERFELEEELVIYLNDEEYDLFFFDGKVINVGQILREIIFLEKDTYPTLNKD